MSFPEVAIGQVDTVHPGEYAVSVVFPNLGMLTGIRVPVSAPDASRQTGEFHLPQRGDWGMVVFYQNDARSARWVMTIPDAFWHAPPLELLTDDPDLHAAFERSGRDTYRHGRGDIETQHPDGSLTRITHGPDFKKRTKRKVGITEGDARTPKRIDPEKVEQPPLHLYFEHVTGAKVHLDDQGSVTCQSSGESTLTLDKAGTAKLTSKAGAVIELDAAGNVIIRPGAGGFVKLGRVGDERPVARVGDMTAAGPILPPCSTSVTSS